MTTKMEQETIVRWDQEDREGEPQGWTATAEADAIRFRRVKDGRVVRRRTGYPGEFRRVQPVSGDRTLVSTG